MTSQDERAHTDSPSQPAELWTFRLYVAGRSPRSAVAIANLKRVCEETLAGRYGIEVVDLARQPAIAVADQVLAIPTVVRTSPGPPRRVVGDLSNVARVLHGLHIEPRSAA